MQTIALLFGGVSPEHEVSLNSARNIYRAIDKQRFKVELVGVSHSGTWYHLPEAAFEKAVRVEDGTWPKLALVPGSERPIVYADAKGNFPKVDVVFSIIHGPFGEDGTLQGLLEILNLPYVGAGVAASAIGMDKDLTKRLLRDAGINVVPWVTLYHHETPDTEAIIAELGLPLFVKPANMGSSVGISKADDKTELVAALKTAFQYDVKVLVEKAVKGRELETAVLGNLEEVKVSGVGEIIVEDGFYDYEAKYISDTAARVVVPAENLAPEDEENIRQTARKAYLALGLEGFTRMDVFLTADGTVYVNEPNTLPGFTNISMYPKLWEAAGLPYSQLIEELIRLGLARYERKRGLLRRK
ncbi:MAG: D-alanine--D-alanine ligase [Saprospiraceae bacterium]